MDIDLSKEEIKDWLTTEGNNFCTLPFKHLAIEANGDLLPCCQAEPLLETDGTPVNIKNYNGISDLWKHPARKKMVDAFNNNLLFANCKKCLSDRTKFSPRVSFSTNWRILKTSSELINKRKKRELCTPELEWLEVKFGNKCNLKCRICGIINSSSWARDEFKLRKKKDSNTIYSESKQASYNQECLWIDNPEIYKDVSELSSIKTFHIMGGEPLMVPQHFNLLKKMSESFDVSSTSIWYNTNGTILPTLEHLEILKPFGRIFWSLSIDDIGNRFEYQRKNARWSSTEANINEFHSLNNKHPNHSTSIDLTISIFNVLYLEEIINYFNEKKWKFDSFNHFVKNGKNGIRSLSLKQKEHINQKYSHSKDEGIINSLRFLNSRDLWSSDIDFIRAKNLNGLDRIRRENFEDIFPEMAELVFPDQRPPT